MTSLILFDITNIRVCACYISTEEETERKLQAYANCDTATKYKVCKINGDWRDLSDYAIMKECLRQM